MAGPALLCKIRIILWATICKSGHSFRGVRSCIFLKLNCLTGGDTVVLATVPKPNGNSRGIVDKGLVERGFQPVIGMNILVNFHIGGVPDILPATHKFGKFLNHMPVVVIVKLIAVSPNIEQHGRTPQIYRGSEEFLRQLHKLRVFVVAGGIQLQPVLGEMETVRRADSTGIGHATHIQNVDDCIIVNTVGIGHTPHNRAEIGFQLAARYSLY